MSEKIYLSLLILCGIQCQEIIPTFSISEDISKGESSNYLDRKKRVIHSDPAQDIRVKIETFPYVVNIKKENRNLICVGSILSRITVITAAHCVYEEASVYKIVSGSSHANGGTPHNTIDIKFRFHGDRDRIDGIALMYVSPHFVFGATTQPIHLHVEPVIPGTLATVSGWGVISTIPTQHRLNLRAIRVPIMKHQDCKNIYRGIFDITEKDICTRDTRSIRCCGNTDGGAPLVINNLLTGVYIWSRDIVGNPDVFVLLQHAQFNQWIRSNIMQ